MTGPPAETRLRKFVREWLWDGKTFMQYAGWGFGVAVGVLTVMLLFQKLGGFCGQ